MLTASIHLLGVVVLLAFADDFAARVAFYSIPALTVALFLGWCGVRSEAPKSFDAEEIIDSLPTKGAIS